ncbi:MAG: IS5 family transposase [Oceanicoccus sp.]
MDARIGLTHGLSTTEANIHDINEAISLLHREECFISADSDYRGTQKQKKLKSPKTDILITAFFDGIDVQNKNTEKAT